MWQKENKTTIFADKVFLLLQMIYLYVAIYVFSNENKF